MLLLAHSNMAVSETRAMSTSFPRLSMHPLLVTTMSACCRLLLLYGWWEEIEQYDRKKVSATCNVAAGKDHRVSGVGYLVWVGLPGHEFCFFFCCIYCFCLLFPSDGYIADIVSLLTKKPSSRTIARVDALIKQPHRKCISVRIALKGVTNDSIHRWSI